MMNLEALLPIAKTEECQRFTFLGLAFELIRASQMFFFDKPCYHNPELGLSIVIT